MNAKSLLFFAFFSLFAMVVYFVLNPSYEKSLEAKYYYEIGNYEEAYTRASEAFAQDQYNRMASTIMAQSTIAMKYTKYIHQAKEYMQEINAMATQENITDADRAKIRMMSEIMVKSYKKLAPSVITNEALTQQALQYYKDFENLLEKVNH